MKRQTWKARVVPPRKCDGQNWQVLILPPPGARDEHGAVLQDMRISSGTTDFAEATKIASAREAELNRAFVHGRSIIDIIDMHVEWRREFGGKEGGPAPAGTIEKFDAIRKALAPLAALPLDQIDEAAVTLLQDELRETCQGSTINGYISMTAGAWKWAKSRGLVPCHFPRITRLPKQKTKKTRLTEAQCHKILEWSKTYSAGHWHPILTLIYEAGCRVSEACAVLPTDLDREACEVRLPGTKTRAALRKVYVSPECMALIPTTAPTFKALRSNGPASRHTVNSVFDRAIIALGFPTGLYDLHSFRRSWIYTAERTPGLNRQVAMRLTGHDTESVYLDYQKNAEDERGVLRAESEKVRAQRAVLFAQSTPTQVGPGETCTPNSSFLTETPEVGPASQVRAGSPPGDHPVLSGDQAAKAVRQVWEEFEVLETLKAISNLGPKFREALVALAANPGLLTAYPIKIDELRGVPDAVQGLSRVAQPAGVVAPGFPRAGPKCSPGLSAEK